MLRRRRVWWAAAFAVAWLATGCSPERSGMSTQFQNSVNVDKVTPIDRLDVIRENSSLYSPITVVSADGVAHTLDATRQPLLFEAYWCPHCQRTLLLLSNNRSQLRQFPVIVSTGFAPGTKLSDAVQITEQELNSFHIDHVQVYYLLSDIQRQLTFPTLAFKYQGGVGLLRGEHTLAVWRQALNGATS